MIEPLLYCIIFFVTIALCIQDRIHSRVRLGTLIFTCCCLSIVVRQTFQSDILNYAVSMKSEITYSQYYLREPIVWCGQQILFNFLNSDFAVFFVFDLIGFTILYFALATLRAPTYIYFAVLISFPFVLGMQNVYRQWASCLAMLYSFALLQDNNSRLSSAFWIIIAIFCHNSAAVFSPIWLAVVLNMSTFNSILLISFIQPLIIFLGSSYKSQSNTGLSFQWFHVATHVAGLFLIFVLGRCKIRKRDYLTTKILPGFFIAILSAAMLLESAQAERIALCSYFLMFPILATRLETQLSNPILGRVMITLAGFLPLVVFAPWVFN